MTTTMIDFDALTPTTTNTAFRRRVLDALAEVKQRLRPVHQQIVAQLHEWDVEILPRLSGADSDMMAVCTPKGRLIFAQTLCENLPTDLLASLVGHEVFHLIGHALYPEIAGDEVFADAMVRAMGLPIDRLNAWIRFHQPALL